MLIIGYKSSNKKSLAVGAVKRHLGKSNKECVRIINDVLAGKVVQIETDTFLADDLKDANFLVQL
jgi:hypothetical protein